MSHKHYVRPNEVIGGGYFVVTRNLKTGRILLSSKFPYEHGSYESAFSELERLHEKHPDRFFTILKEC